MSETPFTPGSPEGPSRNSEGILNIPRSFDSLWGYFQAKGLSDPEYLAAANCGAQIANLIEETQRLGMTDEINISVSERMKDLPLLPGRENGIWLSEHTSASKELQELVFSIGNLVPVTEEVIDDKHSRTLWQGGQGSGAINLIEDRWTDANGGGIRLTVASHVPESLLYASISGREYSSEDLKAIKRAHALQKIASKHTDEAKNQQIEYYELINNLPVTTDQVPEEELAA